MIFATRHRSTARPQRGFAPQVDGLETKLAPGATTSVSATMLQLLTDTDQPIRFGQTIRLAATVTGGRNYPYYAVELWDGATRVDGVGPSANPTNPSELLANLSASNLAVGTHTLTARYEGGYDAATDTTYTPSTSDPVSVTVIPAIATTSSYIGQSNATPGFGESTTLYAVVSNRDGVAPTGSVRFLEGSTVIGTAELQTVPGQTFASLTTDALSRTVGEHQLTVAYDGDFYNQASTSAPWAPTSITVSPNTVTAAGQDNASPLRGETTTLYAVVAGPGSGTAAPTGSVVFLDGSHVLGSSPVRTVPGQTNTSLPVSSLSPGTHTISMYYTGDSNHSPSVATTTVTVDTRLMPILT